MGLSASIQFILVTAMREFVAAFIICLLAIAVAGLIAQQIALLTLPDETIMLLRDKGFFK